MKWAFWRRRKTRLTDSGRVDARAGVRSDDSVAEMAGVGAGQAAQVRVRMRRRLIGAAVLLLGTAVVVPMLLDPAPRPLPDNIPIDIPSERTAFAPHLSLPRDASAPAVAGSAVESAAEAPAPAVQDTASAPAKDGSAEPPAAAGATRADTGRWFVQAAALSSQSAAHQLSERLSKAGLSPFVERVDSSDGTLYRVRLGPFASRDVASKTRKHLHGLGVSSNLVRDEQADR